MLVLPLLRGRFQSLANYIVAYKHVYIVMKTSSILRPLKSEVCEQCLRWLYIKILTDRRGSPHDLTNF
jgi:hypothetical protein